MKTVLGFSALIIINIIVLSVFMPSDIDEAKEARKEAIIDSLQSVVDLKNDSLFLADQAIEDFKIFYEADKKRFADSLKNVYYNMTDRELQERVRGNR